MITRRLRRLMAAALVVTVGSPLVVRAQGGQPRSVDRTAVPRMNAQQREALEMRCSQAEERAAKAEAVAAEARASAAGAAGAATAGTAARWKGTLYCG